MCHQEHLGLTTNPLDVEFLVKTSEKISAGGHSDLHQYEQKNCSVVNSEELILHTALDEQDARSVFVKTHNSWESAICIDLGAQCENHASTAAQNASEVPNVENLVPAAFNEVISLFSNAKSVIFNHLEVPKLRMLDRVANAVKVSSSCSVYLAASHSLASSPVSKNLPCLLNLLRRTWPVLRRERGSLTHHCVEP